VNVAAFEGRAGLPHAAHCANIHAAAFAATGQRIWSAQEFSDLFNATGSLLFHASQGFLLAQILDEQAEILTFAVHPDHRCHGLGSTILNQFIAFSAERGVSRCLLEVAEDNTSAISLYQTVEFKTIGCRKGYFFQNGDRIDALMMERCLR
jgi:ribosomal-protein-alanine N-acetyltransferase